MSAAGPSGRSVQTSPKLPVANKAGIQPRTITPRHQRTGAKHGACIAYYPKHSFLSSHFLRCNIPVADAHLRPGLCCGLLSISRIPMAVCDHGSGYRISTLMLAISGPPPIQVHYRQVHPPTSAAIPQRNTQFAAGRDQVITDQFDLIMVSDMKKLRI